MRGGLGLGLQRAGRLVLKLVDGFEERCLVALWHFAKMLRRLVPGDAAGRRFRDFLLAKFACFHVCVNDGGLIGRQVLVEQ